MIFTSGAAAMAVAVGGNDNFSSMYATCFNVIGPALKRVFKSSRYWIGYQVRVRGSR
jgi:hypothetical protein